jgi:hypothetical protein
VSDAGVREFEQALLRFNAHVMGLIAGILAAAILVVATLVLVLRGDENPGPTLGMLRLFFPGYRVSFGGAWIGALWSALFGYAGGALFARAYGPWMLRGVPRRGATAEDAPVAWLPPLPIAVTTGGLLALGLFGATNWLYLLSGGPSELLSLLHHYLPGYTADPRGSLIGALWMFVYGFAAGGCVAWIYDRVVALRHPRLS